MIVNFILNITQQHNLISSVQYIIIVKMIKNNQDTVKHNNEIKVSLAIMQCTSHHLL